MKRRSWIIWILWSTLVVGWMIWSGLHLPKCIALVGSSHVLVDSFLECESHNREVVMENQVIGIVSILMGNLLLLGMSEILPGGDSSKLVNRRTRKPTATNTEKADRSQG